LPSRPRRRQETPRARRKKAMISRGFLPDRDVVPALSCQATPAVALHSPAAASPSKGHRLQRCRPLFTVTRVALWLCAPPTVRFLAMPFQGPLPRSSRIAWSCPGRGPINVAPGRLAVRGLPPNKSAFRHHWITILTTLRNKRAGSSCWEPSGSSLLSSDTKV
jgi:hypothetical protein